MKIKSKSTKNSNDKELKELQLIKKLLVLQLLNSGVKGNAIAKMLGMQKSNFSTMFPFRKIVNTGKKGDRDERFSV
jgi:hypothetical protein